MNKQGAFNWSIVLAIGIGFFIMISKLRSSDIYRLTYNIPINAVFNGEPSINVIYTDNLENSIRQQIRDIREISDTTSWAHCLNLLLDRKRTYNIIRQMIDQLQVKSVYFAEHDNQSVLTLELVASPPILFSYYFTKREENYLFDSIVGLDKIANHYIRLNHTPALPSLSTN
jgi:hypothetical protein